MRPFEQDGCLFVSLNPTEHVAVTMPGGIIDQADQTHSLNDDDFMFFANKEGSLLRIKQKEYDAIKNLSPQSPFDQELKQIVCEYFLTQQK